MATLKYKDEKDRAYGLTGMSVCMCLMENERFINYVDLDSQADKGLGFTPDFFQLANQKLSAKAVWNGNLSHFRLITGLMVSNILCRSMVKDHMEVSRELSDLLIKNLQMEGADTCSLDEDETRNLYYESYNFFHRVFSHPQVNSLVEQFVGELTSRRKLESDAILHILRPLIES